MSRGPGQQYILRILDLLAELPTLFRLAAGKGTGQGGGRESDRFHSAVGVDPLDSAIGEAMARVGVLLKVSRVYVMRLEGGGARMRNTHEWVNRNVGAAMPSWPLYDMRRDLPSLMPLLRKNGQVNGLAEDMPEDLARVLAMQDVASVLNLPMWHGRELVGLVGFEVRRKPRRWHQAEVALCGCLAEMIGQRLEARRLRRERERLEEARTAICEALAPAGPDRAREEALHLGAALLPPEPSAQGAGPVGAPVEAGEIQPKNTMREVERRLIIQALARYKGNKSQAAKHLGCSWSTLHRRMKKWGLA